MKTIKALLTVSLLLIMFTGCVSTQGGIAALKPAPADYKDKYFPGSYPAGATDLVPDWSDAR